MLMRTAIFLGLMLCVSLSFAESIPPNVTAAVAAKERSDKDRERDARDRPAELMTFAGVTRGMKIADVFGGGGYWTELLSRAVAPEGRVTLVNNPAYSQSKDLKPRLGGHRLLNVDVRAVETCNMQMPSNTYDMVLLFMSYHDLYNVDEEEGWPAIDADRVLAQLSAAIKPGGHLLVVDHAAKAGTQSAPAQDLHRIDEAFAKRDIEAHGFILEKTWAGYRNEHDDLSKSIFEPEVRGKTDRFTHLYRKR